MYLNEAIKILKEYNQWRRFDGHTIDSPEMPNPTKIGIAIDVVINEYEKKIKK